MARLAFVAQILLKSFNDLFAYHDKRAEAELRRLVEKSEILHVLARHIRFHQPSTKGFSMIQEENYDSSTDDMSEGEFAVSD